jgi:uncharacterized protein
MNLTLHYYHIDEFMITFKELTVADKGIVTTYTIPSKRMNCDLSFSNLMSWKFLYGTEYAIIDNFLVIRFRSDGKLLYMMPVGTGNIKAVINQMIDDAHAQNEPFRMGGISIRYEDELDEEIHHRLVYTYNRDYFDYIYLRSDLAELKGKKYQPKRNHVNKFKNSYPNWEYKSATPTLIEDCLEMERRWCIANGCDEHEELGNERHSLIWAMHHAEDVGLGGGILYVDGKIVAFTFGAPINHSTFGVHFEKADVDYDGAYTVINQEFVKRIPEEYTYINREEDLGIPGLRKAKLSYKPNILLEKGIATLKDETTK